MLDFLNDYDMKNISRDSIYISFTQIPISLLIREVCFSLVLIPAMFFLSCSCPEPGTHEEVLPSVKTLTMTSPGDEGEIRSLDAFVFEADGRNTLDCYQRIEEYTEECHIASGKGEKILFLVANSPRDRWQWTDILSLSSMDRAVAELEEESRAYPIMTGMMQMTAGTSSRIHLRPLRSTIILNSIRCDFSGESYAGEPLRDVRVYLTYVNASCPLTLKSSIPPLRVINSGQLDGKQVERFREKHNIVQDIADMIGPEGIRPQAALYCYANNTVADNIGSPFTRLVIEGSIGTDRYYYPIRINPENKGIRAGCTYTYDVTITRAGATHPDGDLDECMAETELKIEDWEEKEWYEVDF